MNKLKILELFSGIGALTKALERLNIEHEIVDAVEIDKYAVNSYNAIHNTNFEPQDITKWDKDVDVDLIMHGSPCVTEDSLILTRDGYKEYRDLQIGDYVLTKSNTWQKIAKKFDNGIHKTYYLQGMGFENIHCTSNHKFYVREKYRKGHKSIRCFKEPVFKEVKDITKNDYFGVPVIQEEEFFYRDDLDFWYMIGYYLGDGWLSSTSNDIILACNDTKLEKLKNHLAIDKWKYTYHWNGSCYRFRFASKEMYDFIKNYIGTGSFEKRICGEILRLPKEQLNALLEGYIDSDGCRLKKYIQFSSVNRKLIYGISIIINKVYHRPTCISKNIVSPTKVIDGREVNQHDWYLLRFKPMRDKQDHAFYEDNYIWYPFDKILDGKEEHVYNMEIENDHSYIIQGCISKNCQDFSLAGKQAGGDKGSGTRSSLMYETIRIVDKLRPKYVIWENVKNLLSKKHRHNFDAYLETMEQLGYTNYYQVLNAKDYGIPQNRERVFTVSILKESVIYDDYNSNIRKDQDTIGTLTTNCGSSTIRNGWKIIEYKQHFEFPKGEECKNKINRKYGLYGQITRWGVYDENGLAPTITASMGMGGGHVPMIEEFKFPPKQELKLKLKDMLEDKVDEKYYLSDAQIKRIETTTYNVGKTRIQKKDWCDTLCARDWKDPKCIEVNRKYGIFDTEKSTHQAGSVYDENGLAPTLDTMQGGYRQPCIEIKEIDNNTIRKQNKVDNQIMSTLVTKPDKLGVVVKSVYSDLEKQLFTEDGNIKRYIDSDIVDEFKEGQMATTSFPNGYGPRTHDESICLNCIDKPSVKHNLRIRKLTPKECWRLMGFDDEDFEKASKVNSNSQLYKQAGNSIVVNVLEAILKELLLEETKRESQLSNIDNLTLNQE